MVSLNEESSSNSVPNFVAVSEKARYYQGYYILTLVITARSVKS